MCADGGSGKRERGESGWRLQLGLPLLFSAARILARHLYIHVCVWVCMCVCVYKPGGRGGADHHTAVLMTKGKQHCRGYRSPV